MVNDKLECHEEALEALVSSFYYKTDGDGDSDGDGEKRKRNKEFYMSMKELRKIMAKDNPDMMKKSYVDIVSLVKPFFLKRGIHIEINNKTVLYMRIAKTYETDYIENVYKDQDISVCVKNL